MQKKQPEKSLQIWKVERNGTNQSILPQTESAGGAKRADKQENISLRSARGGEGKSTLCGKMWEGIVGSEKKGAKTNGVTDKIRGRVGKASEKAKRRLRIWQLEYIDNETFSWNREGSDP